MKQVIIILHGWGEKVSGQTYTQLQKNLEVKGFIVYAPDLPGFGKEKMLKEVMDLQDYVEFVHEFIVKKKLQKVILLGHSFGGRIAAKFVVTYPDLVSILILTGAPLIKRQLSIKKQFIVSLVKMGKFSLTIIPLKMQNIMRKAVYRLLGEYDYYKAGDKKATFRNIIAEDFISILSKIKIPTLIVWGEKDTFVPLIDGKEIAQKISSSKFIILKNVTHRLPYENAMAFADIIEDYCK